MNAPEDERRSEITESVENSNERSRRTSLYSEHVTSGARFVSFGGWEMPLQFSGVLDEHKAVRERVGIFDVSHMGEFVVHGPDALAFLQFVTSNDVSQLQLGQAQYSLLLNTDGGVVDDLLVYATGENEFLLCVNAATRFKDLRHLNEYRERFSVEIQDISDHMSLIAIQGPFASDVISQIFGYSKGALEYRRFPRFSFQSVRSDWILARTGYTGEDGFELFVPNEEATGVWGELERASRTFDGRRCGLAARDTLRLEAAFPLYGNELTEERDAISANIGFVIKAGKGDFVGVEAIRRSISHGTQEVLVGFTVVDDGIVREGATVRNARGDICGVITSGTKTPTCDRPIALGYVRRETLETGGPYTADVRGRRLSLQMAELPFYRSRSRKQARVNSVANSEPAGTAEDGAV